MSKTLVGLYSSPQTVQNVVDDLLQLGCDRSDIRTITPTGASPAVTGQSRAIPGLGPMLSDSDLGNARDAGDFIDRLESYGVSRNDAHAYTEGIRRGDGLVLLTCSDDMEPSAEDVMTRYHPTDIHGHATRWRQSGWSGVTASQQAYTDEERARFAQEDNIPIIEEDVQICKRQTQRGGVHIRSYVVERPVEESVTLRQEHVEIERRPVDRPVEASDRAFQERDITATETGEEAVVSKQARVVEEVNVKKQAEQQDRVIREKVRETKVDVDPIPGKATDTDRTRPGQRR